ncbi:MAG: CidA/LrgA family protein [Desulfacinum sp.]|nr:CidA/LrgA family protein [Desulfacinum sp.]
MIKSLLILFTFLTLGDLVSFLLEIPIPGNVIGMMLLTTALSRGWVRLEDVKPAADVLVQNMAFLFVPPGVGLMLYFDLIAKEWVPIVCAYFLSTVAVLVVVGWVTQRMERS